MWVDMFPMDMPSPGAPVDITPRKPTRCGLSENKLRPFVIIVFLDFVFAVQKNSKTRHEYPTVRTTFISPTHAPSLATVLHPILGTEVVSCEFYEWCFFFFPVK